MASRLLPFFCLALLSSVLGCSSHGGTVTFESQQANRIHNQSFNQAYVSQAKAGEYDIILVDSAAEWEYDGRTRKGPLKPTTLAPLRQVMHIHLYWKPLSGTTKNPAAINASIDWYVLGADGTDDLLVYEGAGYVALRGGGSKRTVVIRDGKMEPKFRRGTFHDPIGTSEIHGTVGARMNEIRVKDTLAELQEQTGMAGK